MRASGIIISMGGNFIAILFGFLQVNTPHISRLLPLAALCSIYISRLALVDCAKRTSVEIENEHPDLRGFRELYQKYSWLIILGIGAVALFINFANQVNLHIWDDPSLLLFSGFLITLAAYDGYFALQTNIFPATSRYKRDWFFYDKDQEYRWVAYLQIGFAGFLLLVDVGLLVFSAI